MIKTVTISISLLFAICAYAQKEDGQKLFNDAKCLACHNIEDFKDKKLHKVKSFKEMKGKVSACQIQNDVLWFDDEVHDVATYLNHEYYHFKILDE